MREKLKVKEKKNENERNKKRGIKDSGQETVNREKRAIKFEYTI